MVDGAFQGRLLPGERIAWAGRPVQGLMLTRKDAIVIPFGLIWGISCASLAVTANQSGDLVGLIFCTFLACLGLYIAGGRLIVDLWERRGIRYAVTDRRILISQSAYPGKFTAISLTQLTDVNLAEKSEGQGTITFGQSAWNWGYRSLFDWYPSVDPTPRFIAIDNARHVFDLIQRLSQKTS